ncbi:MAG TPA: polysaccharide biosynthesis/export family protein [Sphingomonas sp.]|jgi:polysaccharide export outer membrane protein|nr:polysaccharide biosynthesis/export family protein [Sphingomonas sp.]
MKLAFACALAFACTTGSLLAVPQAEAQQGGANKLPAYRINPGDEIEVYVWGEERLQRSIRVLPDGSFSFPLVGRVEAAGKLPSDIEAAVTRGLGAQFRDQVPQVTVSVKTPSGFQFSVIGKVRAPGVFSPGKYVNVLEAIGMAGGPGDFADTSNVLILRKQNGALVTMRVRLNDTIKGNPSSRDLAANGLPELQSGDTVIMP